MKTVSYSKEEKIRLLRANGYVVREEKVANFSKQFFAFKSEKKYNIDTVFDSTVKNILLMINPGGGGEEEEEEEQGFYSAGAGIDITGPVISLSHLGFEDLTNPGSDKILFWDSAAGSVGWDDFAATSKVKVSSNDTTPGYLEDKLVISYYEGNVSEILELSTINEGADEIRVLQLDETKINHDNISGVSVDNHHSEIHALATTGPHTDSLPLTDLAPGTAGDIITRQATDWAVLVKGTENYVLKMGATYPAWGTVDWNELTGTQPAPVAHNHAWSDITSGVPTTFAGYGISDTLANLNTALSDATLYKWEADQGAVNIHGDNIIYGSAASTACVGNDARLSDSRTPITHAMDSATYHTSSDITVLNATTSKHGFLPKLGGGTTNYLRADGTWAAPSGSGMVYPGAGIALSTGSAWGTSITNNSGNWNTAYGWGDHASGGYSLIGANPADNRLATWSSATTIQGEPKLTFDGNILINKGDTYRQYSTEATKTDWRFTIATGDAEITKIYNYDEGGSALKNIQIGATAANVGIYWDAANSRVGINDTTPSYTFDVNGIGRFTSNLYCNGNIYLGTNNGAIFGANNEGRITHNEIDFYIKSYKHGGRILLQGENAAGVNKALVYADPDGATAIYHAGSNKLETTVAGVTITGIATGTNFALSSDAILKKNVVTVRNGLDIALSLRPVHFDWKDGRDTFDHIGFIAQDLEKVRPELVITQEHKYVSYGQITAINNAAIHHLNTKIETNGEKIIRLEKRIKQLEDERRSI